jgi:hypothetical protein
MDQKRILAVLLIVYLVWVFITYGLSYADAEEHKKAGAKNTNLSNSVMAFTVMGYIVGACVMIYAIYTLAAVDRQQALRGFVGKKIMGAKNLAAAAAAAAASATAPAASETALQAGASTCSGASGMKFAYQ